MTIELAIDRQEKYYEHREKNQESLEEQADDRGLAFEEYQNGTFIKHGKA